MKPKVASVMLQGREGQDAGGVSIMDGGIAASLFKMSRFATLAVAAEAYPSDAAEYRPAVHQGHQHLALQPAAIEGGVLRLGQ
jgi:hypothetical protein